MMTRSPARPMLSPDRITAHTSHDPHTGRTAPTGRADRIRRTPPSRRACDPLPRATRTTRTARAVRATLSVFGLVVALAATGCQGPVDEQLNRDFQAALRHTSITVYPAVVRRNTPEGSGPDVACAEQLGAWLGAKGLAEVRLETTPIALPGDGHGIQRHVFLASAEAFGAHVREHGLGTTYAMLCEYLITAVPGGGSQAGGVHAYVVDAQGRLVDALLLNSHHELFQQSAASTPADCTALVIAAFSNDWHVTP